MVPDTRLEEKHKSRNPHRDQYRIDQSDLEKGAFQNPQPIFTKSSDQ